ncbi:MAG: helix-turn-helix domain-containing protein [Lachnospiraceae bacterium]|nr:helix-turn-helix domain-containing protein [Lachnospiraceae bacterium]
MTVGEYIFALMKDRGLSQKEFARQTGIAESTVSDWKRKGLNPGADKLPAICRVLNISADTLLGMETPIPDHVLSPDQNLLLETYRQLPPDLKKRLIAYLTQLQENTAPPVQTEPVIRDPSEHASVDQEFLIKKNLARRLRRLARLDRLQLDESKHASGLNLHLFKYLDFLGLDKLTFIREYLSHIQPYMITEMKSQEKFDNAVCVLDEYYRISVYIKADATKGEEIIVSFHENHKGGIAKRNLQLNRNEYVYVFADSVGSHVIGTEQYSINLFIMRGVRNFPLSVAAVKYDDDGFLVRASAISNALVDISNRYLEDLYTSDLDFSEIELFSSLQQLSFTSFGNDIFSNISLLIDSLLIQKDATSRQVADAALCIYCSNVELLENDKTELLNTLKARFRVNSVKMLPQIIERVEVHL